MTERHKNQAASRSSREEPSILSLIPLWENCNIQYEIHVGCEGKRKTSQAQARPCSFPGQPQTLALKAQHLNPRLDWDQRSNSLAEGSTDRDQNQTPVLCSILIAKYHLHKQTRFSWFYSAINNEPSSITPESSLHAPVKPFIIIKSSDYICPFVYLSTSVSEKVLKPLQNS